MTARRLDNVAWIVWSVSGAPDPTGASAPFPIVAPAMILRKTEQWSDAQFEIPLPVVATTSVVIPVGTLPRSVRIWGRMEGPTKRWSGILCAVGSIGPGGLVEDTVAATVSSEGLVSGVAFTPLGGGVYTLVLTLTEVSSGELVYALL